MRLIPEQLSHRSTRDMRFPLLLSLCWCFSLLLPEATSLGVNTPPPSCVTDYWLTINCELNITGEPEGWTYVDYHLEFDPVHSTLRKFACPLTLGEHSYSCMAVAVEVPTRRNFRNSDTFNISLCHNSSCRVTVENFRPSNNIQPKSPDNLTLHETPKAFIITWRSGYEEHPYLENKIQYKLLLEKANGNVNEFRRLSGENTSFSFHRFQLDTDSEYCIKVKSLTTYNDKWSKWSPLLCWKTEATNNIYVILMQSIGPVVLVVGILLFAFYSPGARRKIKSLLHVPSPASFFQPLFAEHRGNLQEWLLSQGHVMSTWRTEDLLITDSFIIVSPPVIKDKEVDQSHPDMSAMLPMLIQGQSSYVGLPGTELPPVHTKGNCLKDTSHTGLPCWAVELGSVDVVDASSSAAEFLDSSHADSGCSREEVTQSPDHSLLSTPQHPTPQFCYEDYCILNKTAEGLTPVLLPREGYVSIQQDNLCKNES